MVQVETPPAPPEPAPPSNALSIISVVRGLGWTLIWMGIYLLGFVAYQLWFTNLLTERDQAELEAALQERFAEVRVDQVPLDEVYDPFSGLTFGTDGQDPVRTDNGAAFLLVEPAADAGVAFAQIRMNKLDVDVTMVEGVARNDLKRGPGHMSNTPMPGQPGNSVISGHRTTYGAPFHNLDQLVPGDVSEVDTAIGTHSYMVREAPDRCRNDEGLCIVPQTGLWVTEPLEGAWLTLTTCHPKFSSRQRLIVFAELVDGPNAAILGAA